MYLTQFFKFLGVYFFIGALLTACGGTDHSGFEVDERTQAHDTLPDVISLANKSSSRNTLVESDAATITGINTPVVIAVASEHNAEYSIDGGNSWTRANGTIANNQQFKIRFRSSNNYNTALTAVVHVGDREVEFTVSTGTPASLDSLKLQDGFTYAVGSRLQAESSCSQCNTNATQYSWVINDIEVGTNSEFTLRAEDMGKDIRINARAVNTLGDPSEEEYLLYTANKVERIIPYHSSFAAVKSDGTVISWGVNSGEPDKYSNIKDIVSNHNGSAHALIKEDGSVITWGNADDGGDSSGVAAQLINVKKVVATNDAFLALREDDRAVLWGKIGAPNSRYMSDLKDIASSPTFFTVLQNNTAWASWRNGIQIGSGGANRIDSSRLYTPIFHDGHWARFVDNVNSNLHRRDGVSDMTANQAVAAWLTTSGTVTTDGDNNNYGGGAAFTNIVSNLTNVTAIAATGNHNGGAFAVTHQNKTVSVWGDTRYGGDANQVSSLDNVETIYASWGAFAAVDSNNQVHAWGDSNYGSTISGTTLTAGDKIFVGEYAFVRLKANGSVSAWGWSNGGGNIAGIDFSPNLEFDSSSLNP